MLFQRKVVTLWAECKFLNDMSFRLNSSIKDHPSVGLISFIILLVGFYWQYQSHRHEIGGSLNATFHSRLLNNREARTIIVCMEDTTVDLRNLHITPTFDNPEEYSLKDFTLSFDVNCSNVYLEPTTFVNAHEYGGNEWIYKYKDDILAAHDDTKKPFSHYHLSKSQGRCYIKTKASYDGAASAFEYNTDVWFFVEPNNRHLSYEDWKINCKKRIFESITDKYYDVYYFARNRELEYQFDVALSKNPTETEHASDKAKEVAKTDDLPKQEQKEEKHSNSPSQELSLADYRISKNGKAIRYELKFNTVSTETADYLLYGHFTIPGNSNVQIATDKLTVLAGEDKATLNVQVIDTTRYDYKDLRLIKASDSPMSYIEDSKIGNATSIKNKSDKQIVLIAYYSDNSYATRILNGGEKQQFTGLCDKAIQVFDTGVVIGSEENDHFTSYLNRFNSRLGNIGYGGILIFIITCLGYFMLLFFIMIAIMDGWQEATQDFSLASLRDTFLTDKETIWNKLWLGLCFTSPFVAVIATIYFFMTI